MTGSSALTAARTAAAADRKRRPVFQGPSALLDAVRALSSEISKRSGEIEVAKALPADLFAKIVATGVFQAIQIEEFGGAGLSVPDMVPVLEEFARADGSTAWSVMIGAEVPITWRRFPDATLREVFGSGADIMTRGAITPRPGIVRVEGGVRVKGVWPLGSGSYSADWVLIAGPAAKEDGNLSIRPDGRAEMVLVALPASDVRILDTWYALGMRATESHDVAVDDRFVPERFVTPYGGERRDGGPLDRLPVWLTIGPFHLGVVLGIARGMIDDLIGLAASKRPFLNPRIRLAEDPLFQHRVGELETRLSAARAFALAEIESVWTTNASVFPTPSQVRARFRSMMSYVHFQCLDIANDVFTLGGTTVLYDSAQLQRRFRDLRTACQHVTGSADLYRPYGALLLGETPEMLNLL